MIVFKDQIKSNKRIQTSLKVKAAEFFLNNTSSVEKAVSPWNKL